MEIKQFDIWIADLNPKMGTEPGKKRPVIIIQTNLLNKIPHPSTIICPLTTNIQKEATILRMHIQKGEAGLFESSDIMLDQMRAIDNRRLTTRVGRLSPEKIGSLKENIKIVLDLE
ncbi:MAG: type II toxin-antitoxin system PemK/MazF family toxin [Mariniphaga sp.]|nr:type II toxin-antitoxin system PemK/MazF family toxin [Mariniphaga sp.]